MKTEQKINVNFKDNEGIRYKVKAEITHRNGYPEFSMTGEGNGSSGQCDDSIKPANKYQKELLNIWNTWHLNGMNSGTDKQTEAIKKLEGSHEYDRVKKYLNSLDSDGKPIHVFELEEIEQTREELKKQISVIKSELVILEEQEKKHKARWRTGGDWVIIKDLNIKESCHTDLKRNQLFKKLNLIRTKKLDDLNKKLDKEKLKTLLYDTYDNKVYEYGTGWIRKDLPKDLWDRIKHLVQTIHEIEERDKPTGGSWDDIDDDRIVALGKHLELEPKEALEDIKELHDGVYSYCGTEYYVLTDDEAYDRCEEYLGDELWQMAVADGRTELSKQDWIEYVIEVDGFGQILNGWDGLQYDSECGNYIIMRC